MQRRNTDEYENWLNSGGSEYPYSGEGLPSGIKPRDLVQRLRAQKLRSGKGPTSPLGPRTLPETRTGNASGSGFDMIRRRS